jgi:apolipoprotein D and lipocalin family protein
LVLTLGNWPKKGRLILAGLLGALLSACSRDVPAPMTTVTDFDVHRYLGQWHQVAATPAWFQSDCVADTTADYALAENGGVTVVNSCLAADGSLKQAEGRARFTGTGTDGRLEVTFVKVLGFWLWPAAGDYWIIGLDPEYRWSVVGQPSRKYAWVLARSPSLDTETLIEIGRILEKEAYDTCKLILTTTDRQGRLCDVIG